MDKKESVTSCIKCLLSIYLKLLLTETTGPKKANKIRLYTGLLLRVHNSFLIRHPKHMLWVPKEQSQFDGSFEHPKHMLKFICKKIFTILVYVNLRYITMNCYHQAFSCGRTNVNA